MMKKRLLKIRLFLPILLALAISAQAQNTNYIFNHKLIAEVLALQYGIPAPVILSVAAIESSGGKGPAAKVLNNHFGIEGKNHYVNRQGHKSRYKQYNNVFESYLDFCRLISRKRFYPRLKGSDNYVAWVKAMSHAGYSEQPEQWEQKVMSVLSTKDVKPSKIAFARR